MYRFFLYGGGGGLTPLKLIQLYSICIFIYIEILKGELYGVKILKFEPFLIALRRNSEEWTF